MSFIARLYQRLSEPDPRPLLIEYGLDGCEPIQWSGNRLLHEIQGAVQLFRRLGIGPSERVGLVLLNQKEFFVSLFALRLLRAVVVPINCQMLPQDIGYVIQDAGLKHVVVCSPLLEKMPMLKNHPNLNCIITGAVDEAEAEAAFAPDQTPMPDFTPTTLQGDTDELAFLVYTSGTSGHPKGVMLSEGNLLANIDGFVQVVDFGPDDRMVLALPLFHVYGLILGLAGLLAGAQITLIPNFSPKTIVEAMAAQQVTILPLVPTLFGTLLKLVTRQTPPTRFGQLRFCVSGGASLPEALLAQIESVLSTTVIEGYGLTETSPVIAVNCPLHGSIPGCVGKPLPNVLVQITNDSGQPLPPNTEGEVWAKGGNVMLGYYNLPEATADTLTKDGWLKTGDLGHLDEAGHLFITGRKKDLIIKAGENISPRPIEEALHQHSAVAEAAAVGLPDDRLGERIAVFVSLTETAQTGPDAPDTKALLQHCRDMLNPTYLPDELVILDELPKNPAGKILKKLLRQQHATKAGRA
ncbi:MAG: AMP-binding protein [Cyanobacteria bacterium HKST-UBA03]|nr:AMP-binding protein [Cyanobacteria bacterium HKST-UBA03]